MYRIDVIGIESLDDLRSAVTGDILGDSRIHQYSCIECDELVGSVGGTLVPFVIAVEEDEHWILCEDCASAVTDPS